MFQIFAARMFEQRVLTAYREKVARERQSKLLEELEEESRRNHEREEKKAKDKDRKKERKRLQRQAKEEERLKKESEKAAEEAKQKEIETKKAEEQRKRKEEQRLKREAERRAAEEDRQRKEEEKRKRVQEEREREAERERKRKEHQERERKKKEDAVKREKEEKIAREKEARERKEREDREKKERDARAKKDTAEKERKRKEDESKAKAEAAIAAAAKRTLGSVQAPLSQGQQSNFGSPHLGIVTPAIPKVGSNAQVPRSRNSSQQGSIHNSQGSSPKTPSIAPRIGSNQSPSTPIMQQSLPGGIHVGPNKVFGFQNVTPTSPLPFHRIAPPPGVSMPDTMFGNMSPMGMGGPGSYYQGVQWDMPPNPPSMYGQNHSASGPMYRPFGGAATIPNAPGMRPMGPQGRGFMDMPHQQPPPGVGFPQGSPFVNRPDYMPMSGHARVPSGGFEPIHRPTPIQRPSSVAPTTKNGDSHHESVEVLSKVMGSRVLLEDDDFAPLPENISPGRRTSHTQFAPRPIRGMPQTSLLFTDSIGGLLSVSSVIDYILTSCKLRFQRLWRFLVKYCASEWSFIGLSSGRLGCKWSRYVHLANRCSQSATMTDKLF